MIYHAALAGAVRDACVNLAERIVVVVVESSLPKRFSAVRNMG